eukprot:CAMPEP_0194146866 /NCGR_PEP_ID=MMETSP0152-20130528/22079_1 /TAXON_ID=1049557 /ORGANISM="Thalassiothrix antarctica, Strain L6-D1" /LENGTH=232 /DNA_ID=CAMNT_0038847505 /DNA_START=12 /DNA_END=710 /DNA_ORIENTATION=+
MQSYTSSSIFYSLPQRERKVKFDFEVANESSNEEPSSDDDLKLAIRLQKEENALALEMKQRRMAAAANSYRRRSGRSCAHGFGLEKTPQHQSGSVSKSPIIGGIADFDEQKADFLTAPVSPVAVVPDCDQEPLEDPTYKMGEETILDTRSDIPTSSILRESPRTKLPSPVSKAMTNNVDNVDNVPAWLKIRQVENHAKICGEEMQKIFDETTEREHDFRRRTGMSMFAPKWA